MGENQVSGSVQMFHVKTMSPEDFEFAVRITDIMHWNLTTADFEFMVELEPDGCFVLFEDSERIGLATTVNFGDVAWFGNLIVDESHRGKGAGTQLVRHSIAYLMSKRVKTVGLYAYMDRIRFYERLGFKYDSEFTVLNGKGSSVSVNPTARVAKSQDLQEIVGLDECCFGASRRKLLEPIILDSGNLCDIFVERERMVGYVVAKVYRRMGEIGPMVCQRGREDVALNLLRAVLDRLEGYEVSMYVPNKESAILNLLKMLGFAESFRVARMFFGPSLAEDCICMAESLERG
jgi:GNAT superfamily N-acetyltransferase